MERIVREDGSLYKEVNYIENLQVKLDIIKGNIKEPLYYINEHGGEIR